MNLKQVTAIYFSATENSKKTALAIATGTGLDLSDIDVTANDFAPPKTQFASDELAVFCAPVYSGRIPIAAMTRLGVFKGDNTPAVVTVNYGNRDYDDALLELMDNLTANGFVPVAAGAFIGQHTFGDIAKGRPDAEDLDEAKALGKQAMALLTAAGSAADIKVPKVKGNHPYKDYGKASFVPLVNKDACILCGNCAKLCPTEAISKEDPSSEAVPEKCMSCFRCVKVCPTSARHTNFEAYQQFAGMITERIGNERKANEIIL